MITLVIGGSGSGKSAYAEGLLENFTGTRYYLATLQAEDEEAVKKVEKHRMQRQGKGFITLEQPRDVYCAVEYAAGEKCGMLLECVSNLVANEMFGECICPSESVVQKVLADIKTLAEKLDELVIVTVNVFEDGIIYDTSTMEYIYALAQVNCALAQLADTVTEVVVGIPVSVK